MRELEVQVGSRDPKPSTRFPLDVLLHAPARQAMYSRWFEEATAGHPDAGADGGWEREIPQGQEPLPVCSDCAVLADLLCAHAIGVDEHGPLASIRAAPKR